jgi:methyl-accepting chemotaxis protein
MRLTVGRKLAMGVAMLLGLMALVGVLSYEQTLAVSGQVAVVTGEQEPTSRAALEMETAMTGVSTNVLGYLYNREPEYLSRMEVRRARFEAALAQYRAVVSSAPLKEAGEKLAQGFEQVLQLGQELVKKSDAQHKELETFFEVLAQVDKLLDDKLEAGLLPDDPHLKEKLMAAMEAEINVNGLGKNLVIFLKHREVAAEAGFLADVGDADRAFSQCEKAATRDVESAWAGEGRSLLRSLAGSGGKAISLEKELVEGVRLFTDQRRQVNTLMQDAIRAEVARGLQRATSQAEQGVRTAATTVSLGVLIALLAGVLVAFFTARGITRPVRDIVSRLTSVGSEIQASTAQQATGASEQSSAVAETVSNVEEMRLTSEQSAQRAEQMTEKARESEAVAENGRRAVQEAVGAMRRVEERVGQVAQNMVGLAERTQAIGEIISTVGEIADQSNLLALNAAIEAVRAGEQGKGFVVVATEIRSMADRSKKATAQVKQILGDIQKATNVAVMSTEESTRSVNTTITVVDSAGEVIQRLADVIEETAVMAAQSSASARQQATGVAQVQQAMQNIDQVARQNVAAVRQVNQAAHDLTEVSGQLKALVASE